MAVPGENCDTELRLSLGRSADVCPAESISSSRGSGIDGSFGDSTHCPQQQQQQQKKKITVFYDGQICVCDVTEVQAKAILSMARRERDDTMTNNNNNNNNQLAAQLSPSQAAAPPSAGLSMKRSLQRFLQKRKSRIGAVSPYNAQKKQELLLFPIDSSNSFPF